MKRKWYIFMMLLAAALLCSCGENKEAGEAAGNGYRNEVETREEAESIEADSEPAELAGTTEEDTEEEGPAEEDSEWVYFEPDEIFIETIPCQGISEHVDWFRGKTILIETREQLDFAQERFGLDYPYAADRREYEYDGDYYGYPDWLELPVEELAPYQSPLVDAFQKMKEEYPFTEYSYAVELCNATDSGYTAKRLGVHQTSLHFLGDGSGGSSGDGMSLGMEVYFCHLAAYPKGMLDGYGLQNVRYPDRNAVDQDWYYDFDIRYDMGEEQLFELYGGEPYLLQTQEELNDFVARSGGNKYLDYVKWRSSYLDFDKVSIYLYFVLRDKDQMWFCGGLSVKDGEIICDRSFLPEPNAADGTPGTTCIYYVINKRFLE